MSATIPPLGSETTLCLPALIPVIPALGLVIFIYGKITAQVKANADDVTDIKDRMSREATKSEKFRNEVMRALGRLEGHDR